MNFPTVVNGVITSADYLSIFTKDYKDSPYIVSVTLTAIFPDKVSVLKISKLIYLNPYKASFLYPPYNYLKLLN